MTLKDILLSNDPVAELRSLVKSDELRTLEPSLAALRMPIPKGYHHKDNLDHSIRVLENAMEREGSKPDLLLRTAALFHDVGKPATREFGKPGVVTFRNHEVVGAKQSNGILARHDYSKADRRFISHIIRLHMRAHGFGNVNWTDSAVRRLAADAGNDEALDSLIVVFYSDLTTKDERKKRKIQDGIAKLEDALARVRALDDRRSLRPALDGHELMAMTNLKPGKELGQMMKFLNSDAGIRLTREEAIAELVERFPSLFAESS